MNIPRQAKTRVMEDMLNSWQPEPRNTDSSIPFLHTRNKSQKNDNFFLKFNNSKKEIQGSARKMCLYFGIVEKRLKFIKI